MVMAGTRGKQAPNSCASACPFSTKERKRCCTTLVISLEGEKKNEVRRLQQI